jgi:DNA/RNA-binding domain of Phe-tRNA-synthetase-like protein
VGAPGEAYAGIRKGPVHVDGRPVLVDAEGPFGNPTSDSLRTSITLGTTRCLVVAYAPAGCTPDRLDGVLDRTAATLTKPCGGETTGRRQLS